jgi:tetratricopeptide (TPR) repeat protein
MRALATALALVAAAAVAPRAAAAEPAPAPPGVPSPQVVEKMGQGDRLYLAGDYRGALFAYQDAVYQQPRYAPARVRLGRAYLAMRYPAQAIAQAEAVIAEDPENAEAKKLLEEAKAAASKAASTPATAAPGTAAAAGATAAGGAAAGDTAAGASPGAAGATKPPPRVYKLPPDADAAAPRPVAPVIVAMPAPVPDAAPPAAITAPEATPAQQEDAAQHYRAALGHLQNRDFAKAVTELSDAILADPKLAVAHSARGSAQFGLGKYREAAEDYRTAMALDPKLGTAIYGLAECHRVLGEGKKAAELYDRYARSDAPDVRDDLRAVAAKRAQELR